jgi:hypothetical protein
MNAWQLSESEKIYDKFYEVSFKEVNWIELAQDKKQCEHFVIILMDLWVAQ